MTQLQTAAAQKIDRKEFAIIGDDAGVLTVYRWLESNQAILVDVRETSEYEQEHIPGSLLAPLSTLDPKRFPRIEAKKLVLHCAIGKRSAAAQIQLWKTGYQPPAINMTGGLRAWKDAGLPTEIQDLIPPETPPEHTALLAADTPAHHPGRVLVDEYLGPLGISQAGLARDIGVAPRRIGDIIHARRGIDAGMAFRLARYFSTCEEFWLRLQMAFDLDKARHEIGARVRRQIKPRQGAPR